MQDPLQRGVVQTFAAAHPLLERMPFETIKGGAKNFNREGTLPTSAFRAINAGFTPSTGTYDPRIDPLFPAGGDLDVDNFIIDTGGESVREDQEEMKIKSLAHEIAHAVIKASNASDATQFNGLQVRAVGSQLVAAGSTSGGDVLSLGKIDELLEVVPGANGLLMSRRLQSLLSQAARTTTVGGYIVWQQNEFGNLQLFYNGIPIIPIGTPDHVYASLSFSEANPGGGSAVGTSIYAIKFGTDGFHGIQSAPMRVKDLGELEGKPVQRTRVDWNIGVSENSRYCVGRLWGIKTGAVVA